MFYYKAFGMSISSEIEIIFFTVCERTEKPDIEIVLGNTPTRIDNVLVKRYCSDISKEKVLMSIPNVARFLIRDGKKITVTALTEDKDAIVSYLIGACMAYVLGQKDILSVHGSCVFSGKKAIILSGDSGAGKSSIAREFLNNGWYLLSDDITVLKLKDNACFAIPSYPQQKLWEDNAFLETNAKKRVYDSYGDKTKYIVDISREFYNKEAKVELFCFIKTTDECDLSFKQLSYSEGLVALINNVEFKARFDFIEEKGKEFFYKSLDIANKIGKFVQIGRPKEIHLESKIYTLLCDFLEEGN